MSTKHNTNRHAHKASTVKADAPDNNSPVQADPVADAPVTNEERSLSPEEKQEVAEIMEEIKEMGTDPASV